MVDIRSFLVVWPLNKSRWFSSYRQLYSSSQRLKYCGSLGAAEWIRNKFWLLWWRISLSIRVRITLNNCLFFFLPQHRCQVIRVNRPCLTANIGIAWHVDASSIVRTLTDNRKLANQIATSLPIVGRYSIDKPVTEFHSCKRRLWLCWSKWSLQNLCREIQCLWFNTTKRTYGLFSLSHARTPLSGASIFHTYPLNQPCPVSFYF